MNSKKKEDKEIPSTFYEQITKCMPIPSVDALIVIRKSLLLLRRNNHPARGQWWLAGGRIRKGESPEDALIREVKEETGLEISSYKPINVYSRIFPERHDITIAYFCKCKESKISLNNEHSEYKLFKKVPVGLHPYLLETIKDSQWEKQL